MSRRITITTRVMVTLDCDAEDQDGEINITSVRRVHVPTVTEVMEALDGNGELGALDDAYANAKDFHG